jgi:hypothetical protein
LLIPPPDAVLQTSATHNTPDVVNVAMTETMAVTNTGNAPTSGTIYAYVFLQNVTLNNTNGSDPSWTCSNYGYEYCTSNATITPNASLPLVFNVTPTAATGYVDFSADGGAASNGSSGAEITDYYSAASTPTAALTLNISANPTTFYATVAEAYTLGVNNVGTAATSGTITLTDTLPADVAYDSFTGTNWICSASLPTVTCTYPTSIAAGNSASSLTVTVTPGQSLAGQTVQNSATLTGGSAANVGPVQTSVYVSSPITFTGVTGFNVTAGSGNAFTAGDSAVLAFGSIPSPSFDGNVLIAAQNGFTGNYTVASNSCATENEISTTFVNGLAATAASGTTPVSYPLSVVGPSPAPCAVTIQDGSGNTATLNVDLSQSSVTVESQRRHSGSTVR